MLLPRIKVPSRNVRAWIFGVGLLLWLAGCGSGEGTPTPPASPTPPTWPTFAVPATTGDAAQDEWMREEFRRLHSLLHPSRTRASLSAAPPLLAAEAIGALAAVGLAGREPTVQVSVYLFESAEPHEAAREQLEQAAPQDGIYQLSSTNGALFFFGYVHMTGPDDRAARFRLNDIASAFAGDE